MFTPIQFPHEQENSRLTPIPTVENLEIDALVLRLPKANEIVTAIRNLFLNYERAAISARLPFMYLGSNLQEKHLTYIEVAIPALEKMRAKIKARLELNDHLSRSVSTLTVQASDEADPDSAVEVVAATATNGESVVDALPIHDAIEIAPEAEDTELTEILDSSYDSSLLGLSNEDRISSVNLNICHLAVTSTRHDPRVSAVVSRSSTQSPSVDERVLYIPLFDDVLVCLYFMMIRLELSKYEYLFDQNSTFANDLNILRSLLQIEDMQQLTIDVNEIVKMLAKYETHALERSARARYGATCREVAQEIRNQNRTPPQPEQTQALTWLFGAKQRPISPATEPRQVTFDPIRNNGPTCTIV